MNGLKDNTQSLPASGKPSRWTVKRLSIDELFNMDAEWQDLLRRSDANPLFLGPAWLSSWWDSWGTKQDDIEALILTVHDERGKLLGLAPLYSSTECIRGIVNTRRIQFIGTNFRKAGVTRTEYVDFILDSSCREKVLETLLIHLIENFRFDEFVLCDIKQSSQTHDVLKQFALEHSLHIRHTDQVDGTKIDLVGDFQTYLSRLGKNTRLRIFNRRKVLSSLGYIEVRYFEPSDVADGFDTLSQLFSQRWGRPIFAGSQRLFQKLLIERLPTTANPQMTGIFLDGRCISVLYDIRINDTEYNLLSGYEKDIHHKLSLGMLHLGFAIEQAYSDGFRHFDLLLGQGQNTDYKQHFCGEMVRAETLQLVRRPLLRFLYKLIDALRPILPTAG